MVQIHLRKGTAFKRLLPRYRWFGDRLFQLHATKGWRSTDTWRTTR